MSRASSKSWGSWLSAAALMLAVVVVSLFVQSGGMAEAKKKIGPAAGTCAKDADCVLVPDGCCGCSQGGKQRAIPARQKDADERARDKRCADVACTAMMSTDATCTQAAICAAGHCQLGHTGAP